VAGLWGVGGAQEHRRAGRPVRAMNRIEIWHSAGWECAIMARKMEPDLEWRGWGG
jgi:hypothetical protein